MLDAGNLLIVIVEYNKDVDANYILHIHPIH